MGSAEIRTWLAGRAESQFGPEGYAEEGVDIFTGKARRLFAEFFSEELAQGDDKPAHKFSSTQFNLADAEVIDGDPDPFDALCTSAAAIDEADLAGDGRESGFHVTIKYGLHGDDAEEVRRVVEDFGPVEVEFGAVTLFPAKEADPQRGGDEFDVVKVDVRGADIHRLNARIADACPHTDSHPVYHPHVTLAYVKPGSGAKYAGMTTGVEGTRLRLARLAFSAKDGKVTMIPLDGGDDD